MTQPRIACVFEHPTISGGERSCLAVIDRLSSEEFEFQAFAPGTGPLRNVLMASAIPTHSFERVRKSKDQASPAERTAGVLASMVRADLIHGNSLSTAQFTGLAAKMLGVASVAHVREIEGLNPTRVSRINKHDKLIAVSDAVRNHLIREGVDADRIETIYNGVDLESLHPDRISGTIRAELNLPGDAPLIAVVGQISLRKATDVFVEVACRLAKQHCDLHALVVGERFSSKTESVELERRAKERVLSEGLAARVHFLGWRNDVPTILRDLDILVHTAREEPLGRVLLEASALAVPIVATRVGATPEIIEHEQSGWLVPADDVAALEEQVNWLLEQPSERDRAALAARRRAETLFCAQRCARQTADLYHRILQDYK